MTSTIPKQATRRAALLFRNIPVDLRDQFKAWCARRGITMQDQIARLMLETVRSDDTIAPPHFNRKKR
jgi:hypothetical protein